MNLEKRLEKRYGSPNFEATAEDRVTFPVERPTAPRSYEDEITGDTQVSGEPVEDQPGYYPTLAYDEEISALPAITGGRLSRVTKLKRKAQGIIKDVIMFAHANSPWRERTDEELQYAADLKARKAHEAELMRQAIEAEKRIIDSLVEIGVRYEYKQQEKTPLNPGGQMQRPRFAEVRFSEEAIFLRFKTPLPRNIRPEMILAPDTLTAVSAHVRRRVTSHFTPEEGIWYIVELNAGVRGIPRHVMFADMLERFPKSADGLYIPFGQAANKKPIYISLGSFHHMLIGGQTGAGKSNFLEVVLCTLLRRNSATRLRLILIDLKRGVQLSRYEGVPHLVDEIPGLDAGIITRREQVVPALEWLHNEGERRLDMLKDAGYQDIGSYNARHRGDYKLSHIVAVFDEIADLMMDRDIKRDAEMLMANILGRHRAAGLHLILCTQNPRKEVVPGLIKANCPLRVAFSCPSNASSMVILDNTKAAGLGAIPGRAVVAFKEELEIQVPLITTEIVNNIVSGAKTGTFRDVGSKHDVTPIEIMQWSLDNLNLQGKLPFRIIYQQFAQRGLTQDELEEWLQSWTDQEFVIGSTKYKVTPRAGARPRMLQAVLEEGQIQNNA